MFMTDDQKKYYAAMKKMGNKKPVKATPRPRVSYSQINMFILWLRDLIFLLVYANLTELYYLFILVETASNCFWNRDKQEIWYDYHALHWSEYASYDSRSLQTERDVEFCPRQSKHGVYSYIFIRMHIENLCIEIVLFQGALEYVWFHCSNTFNTW